MSSDPRPDSGLAEFLAARARHVSDGRLVANTLGGGAAALATGYWHGPGWHLILSIALCFLAFGAWGIADRELGERTGSPRHAMLWLLRGIRIAAVVIGGVAATTFALSIMALALGRMIS